MEASRICFPLLLLAAVLPATRAAGQSARAFYTDFDSGVPSRFTGVQTLRGVEGLAGVGRQGNAFSGQFLQNDSGGTGGVVPQPTALTLTDLPQHTSVDLNFLLAVLNTWDPPRDVLTVRVDGREVFRDTFGFSQVGAATAYAAPPGALLTPPPPSPRRPGDPVPRPYFTDRGFDKSWGDQAYDMGLEPRLHNIPHTSDRLLVEWTTLRGFQGGTNESFGIDNVEVVLNGVVPEPSAAGAIFVAAALILGRRQRNAGDCQTK